MNKIDSSIISVLGISMGDEGKGRVVHEVINEINDDLNAEVGGVMKVNGGANAGHTAAGLKLNLLPSGVGHPNVPYLVIGAGVVADPRKFHWESKPLENKNISVYKRLCIDERTQVSDISHRLLDLAWENYRSKELGEENRGSTGRGISPAYVDESGQWQIYYDIFTKDRKVFSKKIRERIDRAINTIKYVCKVNEEDWNSFFDTLTNAEISANEHSIKENIFAREEFLFDRFMENEPYKLDIDLIEETYWNAGVDLIENIHDCRKILLSIIQNKKKILAEFGQAYWLDKRHGFTPNVTASHTFGAEVFLSGGVPIQNLHQIGCCKAYDTKVGTHHFITKLNIQENPLGKELAKLEFGTSTGRQRMVGWFDAVEKGNALRFGGFDELVINKLDALTLNGVTNLKLKICTAYKSINGSIIKEVPRNEDLHKEMLPIYEEFDGWEENIQKIRNFVELPKNAKIYISRMITSIIQVAFPDGWKDENLPRVKFIGVGPNPDQIITDLPDTKQFMLQWEENH